MAYNEYISRLPFISECTVSLGLTTVAYLITSGTFELSHSHNGLNALVKLLNK